MQNIKKAEHSIGRSSLSRSSSSRSTLSRSSLSRSLFSRSSFSRSTFSWSLFLRMSFSSLLFSILGHHYRLGNVGLHSLGRCFQTPKAFTGSYTEVNPFQYAS